MQYVLKIGANYYCILREENEDTKMETLRFWSYNNQDIQERDELIEVVKTKYQRLLAEAADINNAKNIPWKKLDFYGKAYKALALE